MAVEGRSLTSSSSPKAFDNDDAAGPHRLPEAFNVGRRGDRKRFIHEHDQVPLTGAVVERILGLADRVELDTGAFGILARDSDPFVGHVEAGDIPALECQKNRIPPLPHAHVQRASRFTAIHGRYQERIRLRSKARVGGLVDVLEHGPPTIVPLAVHLSDDCNLPSCFSFGRAILDQMLVIELEQDAPAVFWRRLVQPFHKILLDRLIGRLRNRADSSSQGKDKRDDCKETRVPRARGHRSPPGHALFSLVKTI